MSDGDIGLKEYHEKNIVNYMRFSRAQRTISLRTIQGSFKDIQDTKLRNETTFSVDEVEDLLNELWELVKEAIDSELSHQSHTYVLLLRQLFLQAEHWHLNMQADISELENKELLDRIRDFENEKFNMAKKSNQPPAPRLEAVNDTGSTSLLREEINRLANENKQLKDKIRMLEQRLIEVANEKSNLKSSFDSAASNRPSMNPKELEELERKFSGLKSEYDQTKQKSALSEKQLESEMVNAKHRYLEVMEQLKLAEKELEKKFNQTNAYKNMKQMLDRKNEQLKELKKRLSRYEPDNDS